MKDKIIPSKPPTQNTTLNPFGKDLENPFGKRTIYPAGESGVQRSLGAEADRVHPVTDRRRKARLA